MNPKNQMIIAAIHLAGIALVRNDYINGTTNAFAIITPISEQSSLVKTWNDREKKHKREATDFANQGNLEAAFHCYMQAQAYELLAICLAFPDATKVITDEIDRWWLSVDWDNNYNK